MSMLLLDLGCEKGSSCHLTHGDEGQLAILDGPILGGRKLFDVLGGRVPREQDEEQRCRPRSFCHYLASLEGFLRCPHMHLAQDFSTSACTRLNGAWSKTSISDRCSVQSCTVRLCSRHHDQERQPSSPQHPHGNGHHHSTCVLRHA